MLDCCLLAAAVESALGEEHEATVEVKQQAVAALCLRYGPQERASLEELLEAGLVTHTSPGGGKCTVYSHITGGGCTVYSHVTGSWKPISAGDSVWRPTFSVGVHTEFPGVNIQSHCHAGCLLPKCKLTLMPVIHSITVGNGVCNFAGIRGMWAVIRGKSRGFLTILENIKFRVPQTVDFDFFRSFLDRCWTIPSTVGRIPALQGLPENVIVKNSRSEFWFEI